MYKKLLFILFFSLPLILFAQTIEYFGDTVDFKPGRRSVNAEIRLRNATRNITGGALVNKGGGLLAFRKVLTKVNDSTYLILDDTLHLPTFITSVVEAVSADWNTLQNKPNLAAVALSNDYNDLINKPSFTGTGDTIINNYDSIVIHNDTTINNYYGNAPPDTITINVVRDFGFVPDGITDNYNQSIALRNFINARHGYAEIIYPQGRYYIGQYRKSQPIYDSTIVLNDPEDTSATAKADTTITQVGYTPNGIQNFNYIDCQALTIRGIGGVEIVLNGAFDRATTRTDAQGRKYSDYNTVIPLSFIRCDNVNISNINILGGNQYMTENDPSVFEGDGHGLVIKSSSHFIVQNVNIYNIETDAVYIETTSTDYLASHDLSFKNCIWSHAGRQACTVGSAYDVYFDQVQFISTRDTTGGAMGNYPGNAPGKGCDIEPNFSPFGKMKGQWTQNINYNNCIFKDNRGGSIAFSLADRIRGINIVNTELNDTLYNHKYAMITGVLDVLVKDCHIYTGTGQLYPLWHFGTAQRGKWINNYVETGSEGFVVATKAQFGLTLDGNTIVGKHDSTWHGYFPSINGPCTYTNNKHFIDAPLYASNSTRLGIIQGATTSAGNFFYSEKDSSVADYYHINYASTKTVERDFFNLDDAIRPLNEDAFFTDGTPFFSAGAHGQGSVQEYNVIGNKKLKQYWLNDLPVTGIYNVGDRIQMINPLAAGGIDHYTVRTGGNAALGQVQYDTSFTGRPTSNGGTVDLSDYYSKLQSDARYPTQSELNNYLLSADATTLFKSNSYVPAWAEITGKPAFAAVASTGDYDDLINKPTGIDVTAKEDKTNKTAVVDTSTVHYPTAKAVLDAIQLATGVKAKDFGVTGDGSTDDAAKFQTFVNYVATNNVVGIVTDGNYRFNSPVLIPSNLQLYGTAKATIVRGWAAGSGNTTSLFTQADYTTPLTNVKIVGLNFDQIDTSMYGRVMSLRCDDLTLNDITVKHFSRAICFLLAGDRMRLNNVKIGGCIGVTGEGGIRYAGGVDFMCSNAQVLSGDDCFQFVPVANPADPLFNLSISNGTYIHCKGYSIAAREMVVGNEENNSCTVNDVHFIDVTGGGGYVGNALSVNLTDQSYNPVSITSLVRSGNVVTMTVANTTNRAFAYFNPFDTINVTGASDATLNGSFPVLSVDATKKIFTYNNTGADVSVSDAGMWARKSDAGRISYVTLENTVIKHRSVYVNAVLSDGIKHLTIRNSHVLTPTGRALYVVKQSNDLLVDNLSADIATTSGLPVIEVDSSNNTVIQNCLKIVANGSAGILFGSGTLNCYNPSVLNTKVYNVDSSYFGINFNNALYPYAIGNTVYRRIGANSTGGVRMGANTSYGKAFFNNVDSTANYVSVSAGVGNIARDNSPQTIANFNVPIYTTGYFKSDALNGLVPSFAYVSLGTIYYYDSSVIALNAGKLGIGTGLALYPLHVKSGTSTIAIESTTGNSTLRLQSILRTYQLISNVTTGALNLSDVNAGLNRMILDSLGNLGVGVAPNILYKLTVSGNISSTATYVTGTGGNGFLELQNQTSAPAVGATNSVRMYSLGGAWAWKKQSDGFQRRFLSTLTADRDWTWPDKSGTVAMTADNVSQFTNDAGYVIGVTDATITKTGTTVGLNLANANTWTNRITSQLTTEQLRIAYDASNFVSATVSSTGVLTMVPSGGSFVVGSSFQTNATATSADLSAAGSSFSRTSTGQYLFGGGAITSYRVGMRGSTAAAITAGDNYASLLVGQNPITEATSGAHAVITNAAFLTPVITNGTATTGIASVSYFQAAPTGVTGTTGNYSIYSEGKIGLQSTITATGTTGNQTINNPAGTVNVAAGGTSVTVTNSLVTANSIVYCVVRTNDANNITIKNVVSASGSFTINLTAAPTGEISIGFIVYN